ncbi:hypothetical protein PCH70_00610 [Pseudomonas cichorii JBC1]|nr:hypothetical protein PCH70_00610 [Pseudomonas cichorii JBC1]
MRLAKYLPQHEPHPNVWTSLHRGVPQLVIRQTLSAAKERLANSLTSCPDDPGLQRCGLQPTSLTAEYRHRQRVRNAMGEPSI